MQPNQIENQMQGIRDVQRIFNETEEGKRLWIELERLCFVKTTTAKLIESGAIDPLKMAFNEGVRSVFLHLQTKKNTDLAEHEQKLKEQAQ